MKFLQTDTLIVTDPKALQYIYNSGDSDFDKQHVRQERVGLVIGRSLVWAEGDVHHRQRKIANPAFAAAEAKAYIPWFLNSASKVSISSSVPDFMLKSTCQLTEKWKDMIDRSTESPLTISIPYWLHRATLDAFGESTSFSPAFISFIHPPTAALGYEFNSLVDDSNVLANIYQTVMFVAQFPSRQLGLIFNSQHRNTLPP